MKCRILLRLWDNRKFAYWALFLGEFFTCTLAGLSASFIVIDSCVCVCVCVSSCLLCCVLIDFHSVSVDSFCVWLINAVGVFFSWSLVENYELNDCRLELGWIHSQCDLEKNPEEHTKNLIIWKHQVFLHTSLAWLYYCRCGGAVQSVFAHWLLCIAVRIKVISRNFRLILR